MSTAGNIENSVRRGAPAFVGLLSSSLMSECVEQVNREFALPLMHKLPRDTEPYPRINEI